MVMPDRENICPPKTTRKESGFSKDQKQEIENKSETRTTYGADLFYPKRKTG